MAISIKHAKNNNLTSWTQPILDSVIAGNPAPLPPAGTLTSDIVLASDWNDAHTISGTVPIANGGTNGATATSGVRNLVEPLTVEDPNNLDGYADVYYPYYTVNFDTSYKVSFQTVLDYTITSTRTNMYSGLSKITVGTVAPSSPSVGDVWIDTN